MSVQSINGKTVRERRAGAFTGAQSCVCHYREFWCGRRDQNPAVWRSGWRNSRCSSSIPQSCVDSEPRFSPNYSSHLFHPQPSQSKSITPPPPIFTCSSRSYWSHGFSLTAAVLPPTVPILSQDKIDSFSLTQSIKHGEDYRSAIFTYSKRDVQPGPRVPPLGHFLNRLLDLALWVLSIDGYYERSCSWGLKHIKNGIIY